MSWKDFATATGRAIARGVYDFATATARAVWLRPEGVPENDPDFSALVRTLCERGGQDAVRAVFQEVCDLWGPEYIEAKLRLHSYPTVQAWAEACYAGGPEAVEQGLRSLAAANLGPVLLAMRRHIDRIGETKKP